MGVEVAAGAGPGSALVCPVCSCVLVGEAEPVLVLILLIMPMLDRFMLGKPLPARHGGEYVFFCKLR